LASRVKAR